jgi:D-alanine-D-alanine ligase
MNAQGSALRARSAAVVYGGRSGERGVSLDSGRAMLSALGGALPGAQPGSPAAFERLEAVEIDERGRWLVRGAALSPERALVELEGIEVFVLALHGGEGENGVLQGLLEASGRAYTGSGVAASALCMDKVHARALAGSQGLAVARAHCVHAAAWRDERESELRVLAALSAEGGLVVKPRRGGSSVAMALANELPQACAAVERVLALGDDALVEQRVSGREISCPVIGNAHGALRALPVIEIEPADGRFFDYEQKYSAQGARESCPPRSVPPERAARAAALALRMHRAAGCGGASRSDFIVPPAVAGRAAHEQPEPVFLETNTLPGMTERSLLPRAAEVAGRSMRELCLELVELALEAARQRAS